MSVLASGTQSVTVGTNHQLYTTSVYGAYLLLVDTSEMVNGDVLELSIAVGFKSGGAHKKTHYATFSHLQDDPGKVSVPVVAPFGATFYLKQTAGTSRSFDWCVVPA